MMITTWQLEGEWLIVLFHNKDLLTLILPFAGFRIGSCKELMTHEPTGIGLNITIEMLKYVYADNKR